MCIFILQSIDKRHHIKEYTGEHTGKKFSPTHTLTQCTYDLSMRRLSIFAIKKKFYKTFQ